MALWVYFQSLVAVVLLLTLTQTGFSKESTPKALEGVAISENLGKHIDLNLTFQSKEGQEVPLGNYFKAGKPVLLTLNYFQCEMLCNMQLMKLIEGMKNLDFVPGVDFQLLTVSIDPRNTPQMAGEKASVYLKELAKPAAQWDMLVGKEENIRALAERVGFSYKYDKESDQYAHGAAIYFLSPEGKLTRYLYGLEYPAQQLKFALMDASEGKVGSTLDKFVLSCFQYVNHDGKYTLFAFSMMRGGAVLTVSFLGIWIGAFWRREQSRRRKELRS